MPISNVFPLSRRRLLAGASVAAGAATLALPRPTWARAPLGAPQAPYFYRFKVGTAECTIVSDGPLPLGDPLRSAPNVVLTPHLGYVTEETFRVFYGEAAEDIVAFAQGAPVRVLS